MISAVNTEHRYVFMNNFQSWLLGIDPSDAVNRNARELLGEEYGERSEALDRQILETGRSVPPYEETFEDATGKTRTLLSTKAPLRDTTTSPNASKPGSPCRSNEIFFARFSTPTRASSLHSIRAVALRLPTVPLRRRSAAMPRRCWAQS